MSKQKIQIALFIGSLRKESINLKVARTIEKIASDDLVFNYIKISDIPIYNQDLESNIPNTILELKDKIENTDSILFVTPEHNRSIPSALKNIIDWASRPWGQNSWKHKSAAIIGASISTLGTCTAQYHLRNILSTLGVNIMPTPEMMLHCHDNIFHPESGLITEEHMLKFVESWVKQYIKWLRISTNK